MSKRLTTEEFIERSKKAHGDKFNYSKSISTGGKNKITIICPVHKEFQQFAADHMAGRGCLSCAIEESKMTTEQFILKSREIHGDRYDYSLTDYQGSNVDVRITCPVHKCHFDQSPRSHMIGYGCKKCSAREPTNEWFLAKVESVHGDKYSYPNLNYQGHKSRIEIYCKKHNEIFSQNAGDHCKGNGCPDCGKALAAKKRKKPLGQIIAEAKILHGDKYTYDKATDPKNNHEDMIVTCKIHGDFKIPPSGLATRGCQKCARTLAGKLRTHTTQRFIDDATGAHGDRYDYSEVVYVNSNTLVKIICKDHGEFTQAPANHKQGQGCARCHHENDCGWKRERMEMLHKRNGTSRFYILKCWNDDEVFYKVGITSRKIEDRFHAPSTMPYNYSVVFDIESNKSGEIWDLEKSSKALVKSDRYVPKIKFHGWTECFTSEDLVNEIISHDII